MSGVGVWDGIVIGGAGGAVAGVTVWLVQLAEADVSELTIPGNFAILDQQ